MPDNVDHEINGRAFCGAMTNWRSIEAGRRDDNSPFFNSAFMFHHVWSFNSLSVDDYQFLFDLLGQPFTTLDTNDRLDRSFSDQYDTGFIESVNGQQANLRVNNVEIIFLVKADP